jgi:acetoin utilization protein AcuB
MFISKVMTRNVVTIDENADISQAQDKMSKHRFRHLPVVDENNRLIGIVTDRDIRSVLPSSYLSEEDRRKEWEHFSKCKLSDIMTYNPITLSPLDTIQDALLLLHKKQFGALPVVVEQQILIGIISVRDLLREFINVLGLETPGTLLCIIVDEKVGQMKKIVDAVSEENISFGSILVSRYWEEQKRAVFPYLLTQNIGPLKIKLKNMGFTLLDPMEW